jgi:ribosomal protein S18 acetylase RimI-like enzyme
VTTGVFVRRVTLDDVAAARSLRLRALETDPSSFGSTYAREAAFEDVVWQERVARGAEGDDAATLLAFSDDEPVGLVSGFRDEETADAFVVVGMWVAPEARGRGIGRRLLDEIEAWIASGGGTEVRLSVTNVATAARRLYERAGYVATGGAEESGHTPGLLELGMRKALG